MIVGRKVLLCELWFKYIWFLANLWLYLNSLRQNEYKTGKHYRYGNQRPIIWNKELYVGFLIRGPSRWTNVNGPVQGSYFELQARERHHLNRTVQPHKVPLPTCLRTSPLEPPNPVPSWFPCQRARPRLLLWVTSPQTSPSEPHGPAPWGSVVNVSARGSVSGSRACKHQKPPRPSLAQPHKRPNVSRPVRGSVFELRAREHHHRTARSSPMRFRCQRVCPRLCFWVKGLQTPEPPPRPSLAQPHKRPNVSRPVRGSVFELRAREHHHRTARSSPMRFRCQRVCPRLRFWVKGLQTPEHPPSLLGPAPQASPCQWARPRLCFSVAGPQTSSPNRPVQPHQVHFNVSAWGSVSKMRAWERHHRNPQSTPIRVNEPAQGF